MVGCAIFEIRAGFPILEERASYFGRDGQPKNEKEEQLARVLVKAYKTSIRAKIGDTALDAKLFFFPPTLSEQRSRFHARRRYVLNDCPKRLGYDKPGGIPP